jgi:sugar phosphate isomerase/epimerase
MAIKLAFSTVACPDWTIEKVAQQAAEMGYQGVELRTLGPGSSGLACDPALSDPAKVGQVLKSHGIEPVCLSTSLSLHHNDPSSVKDSHLAVKHSLEMAAKIGCPAVRVFGHEAHQGASRNVAIQRIAQHAADLADTAGHLGVRLLFENGGSFAKAKEWWWLLNVVDHPMVGLCWNVANAAAAGEPSSVSVTMLNSRIQLAKVKDTRIGEGSGFVPLGEGTVGIEQFIKRLLGIGYEGYVSVEWDRLWLPSLDPAEEYLPDAHQRLKGWLDAVAELEQKGRAAAAKAAAKNAPKPKAKAG